MKKIYYLLLMMITFFSCTDETEKIEVSSIKLDKDQITMMVGDEAELKVTIEPVEAKDVELVWSVNHEDVVSVIGGKITALAAGDATITVTTPNNKKATCEIVVKEEEGGEDENIELEALDFIPYAVKAKLVSYSNSLFRWTLTFEDELAHNNFQYFYRDGFLLNLDIYSTDCNFAKGIPTGEIEIVSTSNADANGVARLKRVDNKNNTELFFLNGKINIAKEGDNYNFGFEAKGAKYKLEFESTLNSADNNIFTFSNGAYLSTITSDINDRTTYKKAVYYFGPSGPELYIGDETIEIEPSGFIKGNGKVIQIYRNTNFNNYSPSEYDLTGTFIVDKNTIGPNVINPGEKSNWGDIFGSCLWTQDDDFNRTEVAPIKSGEITVELNETKDIVKVTLNCKDDALPENNVLDVIYEGPCLYYDVNDTGDFGAAYAGFYGPFLFDSPNMNWFVQLHSKEYKESNSRNGKVYAIDLLSTATSLFRDGLTEGTYNFDHNGTLGEMTIQNAEVWNYTNGAYDKDKDLTKIVDGTVNVKFIPDGSQRYEITIDAVDENGVKITGTYNGTIPVEHAATAPMANRVFNPKDAIVKIYYEGEANAGKRSRWTLEMVEKSASYTDGLSETGLLMLVEFFVDGGHTLDAKGVPTGTFEMYDTELENGFEVNGDDKRGVSNGAYTFFQYAYQGNTGSRLGWTSGKISITGSGDNYSVNLDMKSEAENIGTGEFVSFFVKADYSGFVTVGSYLDDFTRSSKSEAKGKKTVSKFFSKTGM